MRERQRRPTRETEARLDELRRQAELSGRVDAKGVQPTHSPLPVASAQAGYYGLPLLKAPVWTWEVPTYFFVGGAAGASAVIGEIARLTGADEALVRDARWIAAIGANASAPLLIADLGRPARFLNMMRVFKPQSPMSVGAWTLAVFGGSATAAAVIPSVARDLELPADAAATLSALSGLIMATYTGVLLGATSIPVWSTNAALLPVHFGASAVASAVSILELRGHRERSLNALGAAAALFETLTGLAIETRRDRESEPLRHGTTGTTMRLAGVFSGPVPLLLRLLGSRKAAAASALLGSLITRLAWVEAGRASVRDPEVALD